MFEDELQHIFAIDVSSNMLSFKDVRYKSSLMYNVLHTLRCVLYIELVDVLTPFCREKDMDYTMDSKLIDLVFDDKEYMLTRSLPALLYVELSRLILPVISSRFIVKNSFVDGTENLIRRLGNLWAFVCRSPCLVVITNLQMSAYTNNVCRMMRLFSFSLLRALFL